MRLDVAQFIGLLAVTLLTAKVCGRLANLIGQPIVLGELLAGVILGTSVCGLVDPHDPVLHVFAEIGVIILMFEIGLEIDIRSLLRTGGVSITVAVVGVILPFALGYGVCALLGMSALVATVAGATLTATSVGITARVLADLGRLQEPESQVILGAAVIDDVIGLVILAVIGGLAQGRVITVPRVATIAAIAFGFLIATIVVGRLAIPPVVKLANRVVLPGTPTILAMVLAFALAWLAAGAGSAMIIGAFCAGIIIRETPSAQEVEKGVAHLGHFFVPLFFVVVGASVDARVLNAFNPANHRPLLVGGLLITAAVAGKFLAGYAPFWFKGNKMAVGIGMIPRGEVGLIFAQMGLTGGIFDTGMFSAVMLMVMVTTFIAPPLLRIVFPPVPDRVPSELEGLEELTAIG